MAVGAELETKLRRRLQLQNEFELLHRKAEQPEQREVGRILLEEGTQKELQESFTPHTPRAWKPTSATPTTATVLTERTTDSPVYSKQGEQNCEREQLSFDDQGDELLTLVGKLRADVDYLRHELELTKRKVDELHVSKASSIDLRWPLSRKSTRTFSLHADDQADEISLDSHVEDLEKAYDGLDFLGIQADFLAHTTNIEHSLEVELQASTNSGAVAGVEKSHAMEGRCTADSKAADVFRALEGSEDDRLTKYEGPLANLQAIVMRVHANSKDGNDEAIKQLSDNVSHSGRGSNKNSSASDKIPIKLRSTGEGSLASSQQQCATAGDNNLNEGPSINRATPPHKSWGTPAGDKRPVSVRLAITGFGPFRHLHNFSHDKKCLN